MLFVFVRLIDDFYVKYTISTTIFTIFLKMTPNICFWVILSKVAWNELQVPEVGGKK